MKTCCTCKRELPEEAFARCKANADGWSYKCRECHRAYLKQHYADNRQAYIDKAARWDAKTVAFMREQKSRPCADCGCTFPVVCMDFDHRPGTDKRFSLAACKGRGFGQIKAEIAKCDVVCANCHRVRTADRRGGA